MRTEYSSKTLQVAVDLPSPKPLNTPETAAELEEAVETASDLVELLIDADSAGRAWRGVEGSRLVVDADVFGCAWRHLAADGEVLAEADDWRALPGFLEEDPAVTDIVINP